VEALPGTRAGNYIAGQLIKSCHSPTFNYGEAQAAESREDFIHKLGIVLKELKECRTALKIMVLLIMYRYYLREVLKIVILSEAKKLNSFKINKIDSSLRSE